MPACVVVAIPSGTGAIWPPMKSEDDTRTNKSEREAIDCECCGRPLPYHYVTLCRAKYYKCEGCRMLCFTVNRFGLVKCKLRNLLIPMVPFT